LRPKAQPEPARAINSATIGPFHFEIPIRARIRQAAATRKLDEPSKEICEHLVLGKKVTPKAMRRAPSQGLGYGFVFGERDMGF
jgi:hypothetical protein